MRAARIDAHRPHRGSRTAFNARGRVQGTGTGDRERVPTKVDGVGIQAQIEVHVLLSCCLQPAHPQVTSAASPLPSEPFAVVSG